MIAEQFYFPTMRNVFFSAIAILPLTPPFSFINFDIFGPAISQSFFSATGKYWLCRKNNGPYHLCNNSDGRAKSRKNSNIRTDLSLAKTLQLPRIQFHHNNVAVFNFFNNGKVAQASDVATKINFFTASFLLFCKLNA